MKRGFGVIALLITVAIPSARAQTEVFVSLDSSRDLAVLDRRVTVRLARQELSAAVTEIARLASLRLTYDASLAGLDKRVWLELDNGTVRAALQRVLSGSAIAARVSAAGQLVLVAGHPAETDAGIKKMTVRGTVHGIDRSAVEGARVDLVGTRYAAFTHADGTFDLGLVPAGDYTLRAIHIGTRPDVRDGFVVSPTMAPVDLVLERVAVPLAELVVTPAYYGLMQTAVTSPHVLDRVQLETTPQLGDDIYRAMSRMPGVSADDFSAKFAVRGATGDELFVTLDGLPLVEPFHLKDIGNSVSILDIQTLSSAELIAGGAPAPYGDHTGGVLTMETMNPRTDRIRGSTGLSIMNARGMVQGGFAGRRGGWLVSARRGYVDLALKLAGIDDSIQPRYYDLFGKVRFDVGRFGRISLEGLSAQDRFRFLENDDAMRSRYSSNYGWIRWESTLGERLTQQTVASAAGLSWHRLASGVRNGSPNLYLSDDRSLDRLQVRQDWTAALSSRLLVRAGLETSTEDATYDNLSWIRHDTVVSSPTIQSRYDTTSVAVQPGGRRFSAYLSTRARPIEQLTLEGGGRFDRTTYSGDAIFSPRINAVWQVGELTTVKAAWGRHVKSEPLFALQAQNGQRQFDPAERAEQREVSVEQGLPLSIKLRVQGYERRMTNQRARWINIGNGVDLIPELAYDREFIAPEGGRARGVETWLGRERSSRMDWSAAYVLSRVTDNVGGIALPRSGDQRHAIHLDWGLHPMSNAWRLTVAGIWHSGWPYTPDALLVDTLVNTPTQLSIFTQSQIGAFNSARAPAYGRIDARWTRYFETRRGRVTMFAEVFNLLNRHNLRGRYADLEINRRQITAIDVGREMLGRLPSIGINWEF